MTAPVSNQTESKKKERPAVNSTRGKAIAIAVGCPLAVGVFALFFPVIRFIASMVFPRCLLDVMGLRCALCGGTRCVGALCRFDWALAFYYNPLVCIAMIAIFALYILFVVSCFSRPYRPMKLRFSENTGWVVAAVLIAYTILRNLPFYRAVLF